MKEPHSSPDSDADFDAEPPRRFIRESFRDYWARRGEYLTFRELWFLERRPGLCRRRDLWTEPFDGEPDAEPEDAIIGHAVHAWFLEGYPAFRQRYVLDGPTNHQTGRAYRRASRAFARWQRQQKWLRQCIGNDNADERTVITGRELWRVQQVLAALDRNPDVWQLFERGAPEVVARASYRRVPCQIRCDWFHPVHGIVELKTCGFIPRFWKRTHFMLLRSLAFQQSVFAATFYPHVKLPDAISHPSVHLVLVETTERYRVQVHDYDFDHPHWVRARYENEHLLRQLAVR